MRLNEFNSLALLIVADPKCLAGASFPSTVKDQAAIQQIASHLGVYFKTSTTTPLTRPRVRAFEHAGRVMLEVSQGFSIYRHETGNTTIQNIRSSVMIMKAEKHWVMWMFASGHDDEFEKLRATKVFFEAGPKGKWRTLKGINLFDGQTYQIAMVPTARQNKVIPESFRIILRQYLRKTEVKSLAPDGTPCIGTTQGLLRRTKINERRQDERVQLCHLTLPNHWMARMRPTLSNWAQYT